MTELQLNVQGQAPEGGGGNAPSHGHGNPGSEINPIVALNNDENLGVPEASGKHGPAVASPVANSGEPPTHGNDHSIPADASEHGNAPSHSHGKPGSEMNPIVALNNDENLGVPEVSGKHGPAVARPGREFRGAADPRQRSFDPSRRKRTRQRTISQPWESWF